VRGKWREAYFYLFLFVLFPQVFAIFLLKKLKQLIAHMTGPVKKMMANLVGIPQEYFQFFF